MESNVLCGSIASFERCRYICFTPTTDESLDAVNRREWDGPAALPPPKALMVRGRLVTRRSTTMPRTATVHAVTAIGIDMGKNTLHMVGLDTCGTIVLREKVSRGRITSRLANLPPCLIGIEAGMATHYVARELAVLGHDVKQVPPAYSKPFRQGQKNDFRDAFAVAEAVQRPTTRFVPAPSQSSMQANPNPDALRSRRIVRAPSLFRRG